MSFDNMPFEEQSIEALDIEELESRLEMASASDASWEVTVTVEVAV